MRGIEITFPDKDSREEFYQALRALGARWQKGYSDRDQPSVEALWKWEDCRSLILCPSGYVATDHERAPHVYDQLTYPDCGVPPQVWEWANAGWGYEHDPSDWRKWRKKAGKTLYFKDYKDMPPEVAAKYKEMS